MGYNLHITRADTWRQAKCNPIKKSEWDLMVLSDCSLLFSTTEYYEHRIEDGVIERVHPVYWMEHADQPAFWYADGEITCRNPDDVTVQKLLEIAKILGARVFGDNGEEYA